MESSVTLARRKRFRPGKADTPGIFATVQNKPMGEYGKWRWVRDWGDRMTAWASVRNLMSLLRNLMSLLRNLMSTLVKVLWSSHVITWFLCTFLVGGNVENMTLWHNGIVFLIYALEMPG